MLMPVTEHAVTTSKRPRTDEKRIRKWRQRVQREEWVYDLVESKRTFGEKEDLFQFLVKNTKSRILLENRIYVLTDPEFLELTRILRETALQLLKVRTNKTKLRIASMMPLLSLVSSIEYLKLLEQEQYLKDKGLALEEKFRQICKEKRQNVDVSPLPSTILNK